MVLAKVIADFFSSLVVSFDTKQLEVSSTATIVDGNDIIDSISGHQTVSNGIAEMTTYFKKQMENMLMEFDEQRKAAVQTVNDN
ncbi:hypothetical protein CAEBREN_15344 [Caenorhabditis brenneri]|uniref:Uncharacterized protein n=1 Tax=Caenorhabditis brenneri TaxID=135651 RepID=G0N4F6_CAEBE|nr:hypothetical protein CAEBREN_15344 [Caenorhabditis brenneri]